MNNELSPRSNAPAGELHSVSGLFIIPCLFTAAGGYMDAFSYIAHLRLRKCADCKFCVLRGVRFWKWAQAGRHVPPIVAFCLRVAVAKVLGVKTQKHTFRATLRCQAFDSRSLQGETFDQCARG
jgi:hypothetical protein